MSRRIPVIHDFPENSTAVETRAIKRVLRVMRRLKVSRKIAYAGVYNCRNVSGQPGVVSQHAFGNAADLMLVSGGNHTVVRREIAAAVVYQATHRTWKNRFVPIPVSEVIDHDGRQKWEPGRGWYPYTGVTGDHVHVSGAPYLRGIPPCMHGA